MVIEKLLEISQTNSGWDLIKALSSYYGLRDYLRVQYAENISRKRPRKIFAYRDNPYKPGDQYFWQEVFTGKIKEGDMINLINFQVSPWVPRKPGLFWTYNAAKARNKAIRYHIEDIDSQKGAIVFDIYGKTLMAELGGVGCVNFRKNRNDILLTATASGDTQCGIPIICNSAIWHTIESELQKERMLEIDFTGIVEEVPLEYDAFLLRFPNVPKIALRIGSILNLKLKSSALKINVTPWTLFETDSESQPYGFTFINHSLFHDNMDNSVNWIYQYIEKRGGKTILTDFDEENNSLNAEFPLQRCLAGEITHKEVMRYCQNIYRKFYKNNI